MMQHDTYMRQAIEAARAVPELPFGAVIVDREAQRILASGSNQTSANPLWHGEIVALNKLFSSDVMFEPRHLVLYTTAEPCPMCQGAILWCGLQTVVYGTSIRTLKRMGWRQIDIRAEEVVRRSPTWKCTIIEGVLEKECDALFASATKH